MGIKPNNVPQLKTPSSKRLMVKPISKGTISKQLTMPIINPKRFRNIKIGEATAKSKTEPVNAIMGA